MLARALGGILVAAGLLVLFGVHARRTYLHDYAGGGDSPHFLMMARSLARDGDLRLGKAERSLEGFYEDFPLELDSRVFSEEHPYCKHPVGAPVLFAAGYWLGGRQGVLFEIAGLATLTALLLWLYLRRLTGDATASLLAMLAVALCVPFLPLAANEYTEMPALFVQVGGLVLLAGVRGEPGDRLRLLLAGAAVGALPWLHARYLPVAAALAVAGWMRTREGASRAWLIAPALLAIAGLYAWGVHVLGEFSLSLPMTLSAGNTVAALSPAVALRQGLWGHFTDQQGGLLTYAPHLALAVLGAPEVWRRWPGEARLHLGYGLPTLLVVSMFPNWSGHWGLPCRFLAVLLPGIALALVPVARAALERGALGLAAVAPPLCYSLGLSGAMLRWPPLQLSLEGPDVNLGAPFVYLYQRTGIRLLVGLPRFIYTPHLRDYLLALAMLLVTAAYLRVARRLLAPRRAPGFGRALAVLVAALAAWWSITALMPFARPLDEDLRWSELNVRHLLSYPIYYELLAEQALAHNRYDVARRCVERELEVWPEYVPAYAQMATITRRLRLEEATLWAQRGLDEIARAEGPIPEQLFMRGYLNLIAGNREQARADLSAYLKQRGPQAPVAQRLLERYGLAPGTDR